MSSGLIFWSTSQSKSLFITVTGAGGLVAFIGAVFVPLLVVFVG
jgi:hypothetical protein